MSPYGGMTKSKLRMKKIAEIQATLSTTELLTAQEAETLKGGRRNDDKRRQRPGGGTTTTSPSRCNL